MEVHGAVTLGAGISCPQGADDSVPLFWLEWIVCWLRSTTILNLYLLFEIFFHLSNKITLKFSKFMFHKGLHSFLFSIFFFFFSNYWHIAGSQFCHLLRNLVYKMIKFASVSDPPHHVSCIDPPQRFEVYFIFTRNLIILKIILKFITTNNRSWFVIHAWTWND